MELLLDELQAQSALGYGMDRPSTSVFGLPGFPVTYILGQDHPRVFISELTEWAHRLRAEEERRAGR